MKKKNQNDNWFASSESPNINSPVHNSAVTQYVEQTHTLKTFYLIAGLCQVLLGLAVVTISILGLVQSYWLSTALIMAASITTMIGLFLVYITIARKRDSTSLLRSAMQRVMQHKN
ncbi:MAG: hypothetical protein ACQEST_04025 [Bacteroidota bacterium]